MIIACKSCSQVSVIRSNPNDEASCDKSESRSASEPVSASLRKLGVVNLPEMVKPKTDDEATGASSRRAPRGGRGRRSRRDWTGTWETLQGAEEGATCDRKP